jgi:adenine-specific DNA-methyltransferase
MQTSSMSQRENIKRAAVVGLVERVLAAKRTDPQANVAALEQEIDRLVYALYGLTPVEIKLVEESSRK